MAGGRGEVIGGLGLFLEEDGNGGILVSEILEGGPASQSAQLLEGDRRVPIPLKVQGFESDGCGQCAVRVQRNRSWMGF